MLLFLESLGLPLRPFYLMLAFRFKVLFEQFGVLASKGPFFSIISLYWVIISKVLVTTFFLSLVTLSYP
jgi:hypothetical protein